MCTAATMAVRTLDPRARSRRRLAVSPRRSALPQDGVAVDTGAAAPPGVRPSRPSPGAGARPTRTLAPRTAVLALTSAALVALAAPPFDYDGLAWVALVPVLLEPPERPLPAFLCGAVTGVALFIAVGYGVYAFSAVAFVVVVATLALLLGAVFCTAALLERRALPNWLRPLVLPSLWVAAERGATAIGAPWTLALTQTGRLAVLQSASVLGSLWISFVLVLVNRSVALLGAWWLTGGRAASKQAWTTAIGMAAAALAATLLFGWQALSADDDAPTLRVSAIQPRIASETYRYQALLPALRAEVRATVAGLSEAALAARPDVLVWPEGGNGEYNRRLPALRTALVDLAQHSGATLLVSSHDLDQHGRLFNSVFSVTPNGSVSERYDKVRLTPAGEDAFTAGRDWLPLPTAQGPVGALLCFESVLSDAARAQVQRGARWLLVTASDIAFRNSNLAHLHARFGILRAVENRRAVVEASNGGPSLIVTPSGAVGAHTPFMDRGVLSGTVPLLDACTPYTRWGDLPMLTLCAAVLAAAVTYRRAPQRLVAAPPHGTHVVRAALASLAAALGLGAALALASLVRTDAASGAVDGGGTWPALGRFLAPAAVPWSDDAARAFRQSAENTCGPAALAMLAHYLGSEVSERDVVALVALQPGGTSMAELASAAHRLGFAAWGEQQNLSALDVTPKPLIAHVRDNHYVVVLATSAAGIDLFDPASGYRRVQRDEFARQWQGRVLIVRFQDGAAADREVE
jgi:apolipoprotein N-acyltransferase